MGDFLRHIKITPSLGNYSLFQNKIVTSRIKLIIVQLLIWNSIVNNVSVPHDQQKSLK